jgi:hypothetical protein
MSGKVNLGNSFNKDQSNKQHETHIITVANLRYTIRYIVKQSKS